MIEELFIPYNESMKMRAIGFDEPCLGKFAHFSLKPAPEMLIYKNSIFGENYMGRNTDDDINNTIEQDCTAILYQQAFQYFRDKYNLYPEIGLHDREDTSTWRFTISILGYYHLAYNQNVSQEPYFKSYAEVQLAYIKKLIEIATEIYMNLVTD